MNADYAAMSQEERWSWSLTEAKLCVRNYISEDDERE